MFVGHRIRVYFGQQAVKIYTLSFLKKTSLVQVLAVAHSYHGARLTSCFRGSLKKSLNNHRLAFDIRVNILLCKTHCIVGLDDLTIEIQCKRNKGLRISSVKSFEGARFVPSVNHLTSKE